MFMLSAPAVEVIVAIERACTYTSDVNLTSLAIYWRLFAGCLFDFGLQSHPLAVAGRKSVIEYMCMLVAGKLQPVEYAGLALWLRMVCAHRLGQHVRRAGGRC